MFSILLLFLIFYISKQLQHETYQGIHQTMDLYVQQLNKSMETAENCLWEFANNNTDVVDTITSKNNPNAVLSASDNFLRISVLLSKERMFYPVECTADDPKVCG